MEDANRICKQSVKKNIKAENAEKNKRDRI
jgi:hypothetical protein